MTDPAWTVGPARLVTWPLQQALYRALRADVAVSGLVNDAVFDHVPEPRPIRYIVVGEAVEAPAGAHDRFGRQVDATVHVYDRADGYASPLAIAGAVVALLDHRADVLDVAGHRVTAVRFVDARTLRVPGEPQLRHVPIRFRVHTEQEQ